MRRFPALALLLLLLLLPILSQCTHEPPFNFDESWRDRLYAPTMMTHIDGEWIIVDAWHHRIIHTDSFSLDLSDWEVFTEDAAGPHSVASDGQIYLYDDTGRGALQAVRRIPVTEDFEVVESNTIPSMGVRPHRVVYDDVTERFYTIASISQEIFRLRNEDGVVVVEHKSNASFLEGVYSRSLTIDDSRMLIVSSNGRITETTFRKGQYKVLRVYELPPKFEGMIDVFKSPNGWYYLSAKPRGFARARSLEGFETGDYEDLFSKVGLKGTPYYLTWVDGRIIVPFQEASNGILSFREDGEGGIVDIETWFDFGPPSLPDVVRKQMGPL